MSVLGSVEIAQELYTLISPDRLGYLFGKESDAAYLPILVSDSA